MDEVAEVSDTLMERYLEGEEISHEEIVDALKEGTNHGNIFPVVCGVATRNLGTNRLLDAIVEDLPRRSSTAPCRSATSTLRPADDDELFAYVFKTRADPFAGRINLFRVYQGVMNARQPRAQHARPRQGADRPAHRVRAARAPCTPISSVPATSARWPSSRRRAPATGSPRATSRWRCRAIKLPAPVMAFAIEPKTKGDEDKVFTSLRRLQEEDPTIDLHRDPQTGEQIVAGLSQVHVEVIVDRLRSRFGVEVTLKPPRVPYQETIRRAAKAHGRHKKQTGGRGQFGDCHIEIEPLEHGERLRVRRPDQGRRDPAPVHPGGGEGRDRGDADGRRGRLPGQGRARARSSTAPTTRSTPPRSRSSWPARWP